MNVMKYMQDVLGEAAQLYGWQAETVLCGRGILRVPKKDQIIAVSKGENGHKLWQSCYAEADCCHAQHVWIAAKDCTFVHLYGEKPDALMTIRLDSHEIHIDEEVYAKGFDTWPASDVMGNAFSIDLADDHMTENTLAAFYWHTLIPCVIEGKNEAYPDGYVLSTLAQSVYAGTYPDVDHEFQCKGRIACGGKFEQDLIRRMIELQFRLMREDPIGMWRNPCALQPNGMREYHVRRNSNDNRTNADMFLISGNVEVIESSFMYAARSKDMAWLKSHIEDLEGAASLIEYCMDKHGRLWSDVFYEDQIIKDGMECMSACLAANSFRMLAKMEALLGREQYAEQYSAREKQLAEMIVRPVPYGFWDENHKRFIDWLDRDGMVHDHIHLLANCLPVLFDYCTEEQRQACIDVIHENFEEFQRFPTFLSPLIQDYTPSEYGVPYDLCAAGRYWCWDAAYWSALGRSDILHNQVNRVAEQAKIDQFEMGERYDMNYIYYIDHRNWHGAERYYEYPNVYWWVVVHELLGVGVSMTADVSFRPMLHKECSFMLQAWNLACSCEGERIKIQNTSKENKMTVEFDPSVIWDGAPCVTLSLEPGESKTLCKGE